MISNSMTATNTPNYSATHQKAQPLGELYKNTRLTVKHWDYLVKGRGLPLDWVMDNCESMTEKTATEYLGYTAPSLVAQIGALSIFFALTLETPL